MAIPSGYEKIKANTLYENVEYYIDTSVAPTLVYSNIYPSSDYYILRGGQLLSSDLPYVCITNTEVESSQIFITDRTEGLVWDTSKFTDGVVTGYPTLNINLTTSPDWLYVKAPESKYKAVELYEETELQESAELTIEANTTTTLQLEEGKVAVKSVTITTRVTSGLVTIVQTPEPPTDALKSKLFVENNIYWVGEPLDDATPFIKYIKASDFAGVFADDNYHYLEFDFSTATYYYDFNGYYKGSVGWYKGDEQWVYNSDDLIFNSAMMNTSNDLSYLYSIVGTPDIDLQEGKSVIITQNGVSLVTPDSGYDAFKSLAVSVQVPDVIPEGYITPTGTIEITENGEVDVTQYATANVNVPSGGYAMSLSADGTVLSFVHSNATSGFTINLNGEYLSANHGSAVVYISLTEPTSASDYDYTVSMNTTAPVLYSRSDSATVEEIKVSGSEVWIWNSGAVTAYYETNNADRTSIPTWVSGDEMPSALTFSNGDIVTIYVHQPASSGGGA